VTWLKRNLVDVVMIGIILAVVGVFLTVLLRGGVNPRENISTTPERSPVANSNQSASTPPTPSAKVPSSSASTPENRLAAPQIPAAPAEPETVLPRAQPQVQLQTSATAARTPPIVKAVTVTKKVSAPKSASTQPKRNGQYSRGDFLRNYRIAAGTYSSQSRAERTAAALRQRGLPAQSFSSGNGYVVVVGPYAQEAKARAVIPNLQRSHRNVILYRPNGSREAIAKQIPAPKSGGGGATGVKPQLATAKTSYLQVGAFRDTKSASPLLSKLKQAGFKAIIKGSLDGVARVIVGPVRATDLERIKSTLRSQGLTPFSTTL
jgi:cell division protein FtsN